MTEWVYMNLCTMLDVSELVSESVYNVGCVSEWVCMNQCTMLDVSELVSESVCSARCV